MLNKTIFVFTMIVAFIVGSIITGTTADAKKPDLPGLSDLLVIVTDIQTQVTTLLTNVVTLQTTSYDIKTKTDTLPPDPASNSHIDEAIATITSGGISENQFQILKCNSPFRSHVDLSGCVLDNANLEHANLRNANLNGVNLSGADMDYADLIGADLSDADLSYASLSPAFLTGADLSGANLDNSFLLGSFFNDANLDGTNFDNAVLNDPEIGNAIFTGCIGTPVGTPLTGTLPVCTPIP